MFVGDLSRPIFSASIFVLVALVLSTFLIFEHLAAYNQLELDSNAAFNCEVIRDCYEAFALYCFGRYLIACLGGEESTIEFMESQGVVDSTTPLLKERYAYGVVEHPFPWNCFIQEWYLGSNFYNAVKIGIVQYMIVKMICALLAMILQSFGVYEEGKFDWQYGSIQSQKTNWSQSNRWLSFWSSSQLFSLTWWQGIAVAFLFSIGTFKGSLAQELKTRIQDYIICIEMGKRVTSTFNGKDDFRQHLGPFFSPL